MLALTGPKAKNLRRLDALAQSLVERFGRQISAHYVERGKLHLNVTPRIASR